MNYKVVYDKKGRLRVRCGQYAFSEKEGYRISAILKEEAYITDVITSHKNGSIFVLYQQDIYKNIILEKLKEIKKWNLPPAEPNEKEVLRKLDDDFQQKLAGIAVKRILLRTFMPAPVRIVFTLGRAVPYIKEGIKSLLHYKVNVSVLDAAAVSVSIARGSFDSASSIMFLLHISGILEEYTRKRTKNVLTSSLAIHVDSVWLVTDKGEYPAPLAEVKRGDNIRIRTGSFIPVDGVIQKGEAMINEASMTGEPLAVMKQTGGCVYAGTIVEEGSIIIEVTAVSSETRIHRIIEMIEQSEQLKASIQSKAEILADRIVPFSFLAFFGVYYFTRNASKALSVLMVDYSCAIKLSTPISIISAMREAANQHIMVKGGKYLEAFAEADTIVFDKTGTLTKASPQVKDVLAFENYTRNEILRTAACLEEHFPHSVAKAIVAQAMEENLRHEEKHADVKYVVAHGISSYIGEQKVLIGSAHFIFEDEKIPVTEEQKKQLEQNINGSSVIYLSIGNELAGAIFVNDPVREDAAFVTEALKKQGLSLSMLTGDSENAARAVSDKLGISEYKAQVLPEDKAAIINMYRKKGRKVIMVGDGINDSPALSAADVSVAMRDASDIAKEIADITLLSSDLKKLLIIRILSRNLMKKIHFNYQFILWFNSMLLGLGLTGVIAPSVLAVWHNLSTMAVSASSMKPCLSAKDCKQADL